QTGFGGAPDSWLEVYRFAAQALDGLAGGDEIIILTWLHPSRDSKGPSAFRPEAKTYRSVRDAVSRPAQSNWSSSGDSSQNRQRPFANRSHGSHRRHASD